VAVIVINMYCWTVTLIEEHRLRAFENSVLRKIIRERKYWGTGEGYTVRGLTICTYQVVFL
jgi:hypothetical protein